MIKLSCDIQIGPYVLDAVHEVTIESGWDELTDTCTIKLPRNYKWAGRELATGADPVFKRKMPVRVHIGYDGQTLGVFRGYVRDIKATIPIEIVCEDEMYLLKQSSFNASYRSVTLRELVRDMLENANLNMAYEVVANQSIGQLRVNKLSPAKVFEELREKRFVKAWCREGVLYVGWVTIPKLQRKRAFEFSRNIIEHNLEWRKEEDVEIRLKGIIMYPDDKKKELFEGPETGEERTFHAYNVTEAEMRKLMKVEIERLRFTGYRGSFTTFGVPDVRHGDIITITDPVYDRTATSMAKKVTLSFGVNGYRQEIELEG
jgi:hypothetical protein